MLDDSLEFKCLKVRVVIHVSTLLPLMLMLFVDPDKATQINAAARQREKRPAAASTYSYTRPRADR